MKLKRREEKITPVQTLRDIEYEKNTKAREMPRSRMGHKGYTIVASEANFALIRHAKALATLHKSNARLVRRSGKVWVCVLLPDQQVG